MEALIGVGSRRQIVEQHRRIDVGQFLDALLLLPVVDAKQARAQRCLLYTSDAADDLLTV